MNHLEVNGKRIFLDGTELKGVQEININSKSDSSLTELMIKMVVKSNFD